MASFQRGKRLGLHYIRQVQQKLVQEDPKTYGKFKQILNDFRVRNIHSSYIVVAINNLFEKKHPDLLLNFESFVPTNNYSLANAAASADQADSVAFLNKVATRFTGNNGSVYRQLLNFLASYCKGERTISEVRTKVVGLFGKKHQDFAAEFMPFLPESESSNCKIRVPETRKRRKEEEDGGDDDKVTARSRKRARRTIVKAEVDFDLEDSLCDVDVQIGNLTSTYENAVILSERILGGKLSPGDVRVEEHFLPLNLVCIRKLCREFRMSEENILCEMPVLLRALTKKMDALERSRERLASKMKLYRRRLYSSSSSPQ